MSEMVVRDDPENERYVVDVDGVPAGFTVYHLRVANRHFFVHTEVFDEYAGMGVGRALVRGALDDVRSKGGRSSPSAPSSGPSSRRTPAISSSWTTTYSTGSPAISTAERV